MLRFTPYSLNSVFLLTVGAVVLALHSGSDRPEGESDREYMVGFLMMAAAAALYGFLLPLVEFTYQKARQVITYSLVLEYQLVMCLFATAFCTVGMWINDDFRVIIIPIRTPPLNTVHNVVQVRPGLICSVNHSIIWKLSLMHLKDRTYAEVTARSCGYNSI